MTEQLKQARDDLNRLAFDGTLEIFHDKDYAENTMRKHVATFIALLDRAIEQPPITVEELRGMKKPIPDYSPTNEEMASALYSAGIIYGQRAAIDALIAKIEGK